MSSSLPPVFSAALNRKLWQILLKGFENEDPNSEVAKSVLRDISAEYFKRPSLYISLRKSGVSFNDVHLDLSKSLLILKIFRIFIEHSEHRVHRDELIEKVYDIKSVDDLSARRYDSLRHSLVKLVSRARNAATDAFGSRESFDWFVYESSIKSWVFFRRRDSPVSEFVLLPPSE